MEELKKGQKIKIKFNASSIRSFEVTCTLKWYESDRIGLIYPENEQTQVKYLHEGKELEVIIYTEKGIYLFDSIVIDSPYNRDFIIEFPEEKTKIQRREYVRAPIQLDFVLNKREFEEITKTINIGGGGVRFNCNKEFKSGDIWDFDLYLPVKDSLISGTGEILYSTRQGSNVVSVIKFAEIEESSRNKIIKLCFEEEASRLKTKTNMTRNTYRH